MNGDRSHSHKFVKHFFENYFDFLQEHAIAMDRHIIWSNTFTSQFKNSHIFYWFVGCM